MNAKQILLMAVLYPLIAGVASAELFDHQTTETRTSLIELYTSEGCSSCPPAEEWMAGLLKSSALWTEFVPVAFHVDYWDGLGWPDRLARKEFTVRQQEYSHAWASESVYTPGFVLNGSEWRDWRSGWPQTAKARVGVLRLLELEPGKFKMSFVPTEDRVPGWTFYVAVLGMRVSSKVTAGENSGRRLVHDFVVLALEHQTATGGESEFIEPPPKDSGASRLALAAWVSHKRELAPVQALGGWWEPASGH